MVAVSFDFDYTLSLPKVQDYCKKLMDAGINVFVTTFRYNEMLAHLYTSKPYNTDMYEVTDRLGISRSNIIFTNMTYKSNYLGRSKCLFHLDDDLNVISDITTNTSIPAIFCGEDFENQCNAILKRHGILI